MKKLMMMVAAGLMISMLPLKAEAATRTLDTRWQFVEDGGDDICDPSGFNQFMPFSLNDNLHPEVDKIVMMTFVLNFFLPVGGLWGPLVLLPDDHPDMDQGGVLVSYLVPYLSGCATVVVLSSFVVGFLGLVPLWYNAPTAALNAWDRAYKCGGKKSKRKNKKKKKSAGDDDGSEDSGGYAY